MRTRLTAVFGSLALLVGFAASSATGASKPKPKTVNCTFDVTSQSPPNSTSGKDLGYVKCGGPFGSGLQSDSFKDTLSGNNVKASGPVKDFFDTGTIHGTYSISGSLTGSTFTGTGTVAGGTGAFKHIKGSIKLTCTANSTGTQNHCTGPFKYTIG